MKIPVEKANHINEVVAELGKDLFEGMTNKTGFIQTQGEIELFAAAWTKMVIQFSLQLLDAKINEDNTYELMNHIMQEIWPILAMGRVDNKTGAVEYDLSRLPLRELEALQKSNRGFAKELLEQIELEIANREGGTVV